MVFGPTVSETFRLNVIMQILGPEPWQIHSESCLVVESNICFFFFFLLSKLPRRLIPRHTKIYIAELFLSPLACFTISTNLPPSSVLSCFKHFAYLLYLKFSALQNLQFQYPQIPSSEHFLSPSLTF